MATPAPVALTVQDAVKLNAHKLKLVQKIDAVPTGA